MFNSSAKINKILLPFVYFVFAEIIVRNSHSNMEDKKSEENKMEIEISKYKDLIDALGDPVRVARCVVKRRHRI